MSKRLVKVSEFIFNYLAEMADVRHVFLISGGGNMHLVHAVGTNKKIQYICNHHEQACAMGAEAYSRISKRLGVCLVTTGPGATNAITGVFGAWLDSIPVLYLSGQVKRETLASSTLGLRQLGDQEGNTIAIVKSITKYAVMIEKPEDIRYHLEKAIFLATSGRPGPVWLDIPLDIQGAHVDPNELRPFGEAEKEQLGSRFDRKLLSKQVSWVIEKLETSERPVLLVGNGIRLGSGEKELSEVITRLKIPVLTSFAGLDLVATDNPYFFGRPSSFGSRAANFIIQNSDFLLSIGSRLNLRIVTFNWQAFARAAYKVAVDIDEAELKKPTLQNFDLKIHADARQFLGELLKQLSSEEPQERQFWFDYCRKIKGKYPVVTKEHREAQGNVSVYYFVEQLSEVLSKDAVVVMGDGMACVIPHKVFKVKEGQRLILNSGCAAMGYDLPASIAACLGSGRKEVVCLAGDGSIMLNLQELQTIAYHKLPIKIFVLVNDGYLSIRMTQDSFFGGFHVGSDRESGVSCPDFVKIGQAFGLSTEEIRINAEVEDKIRKVLAQNGPVLCVVNLNPEEQMLPKLSSEVKPDGKIISKPLEDLYPFLPREEFKANMLIDLWPEN